MLLTLTAHSVHRLLDPSSDGLSLLDLPDYVISHLHLRGLNIDADMLAGWTLEQLDALRDQADKAGCPCLVLYDETPLSFLDSQFESSAERLRRLAAGANRLGCNAVSIRCDGPADDDDALEETADSIRSLMTEIERFDLNLLLAPCEGLTMAPDRLTDLIKRIGGFRIGSLPTFEHAAASGNAVQSLRKLAPYAGAIHATVHGFTKDGEHKDYDLTECIEAVQSVGFVNTLAIDYTGNGDPVDNIEKARSALLAVIEAE